MGLKTIVLISKLYASILDYCKIRPSCHPQTLALTPRISCGFQFFYRAAAARTGPTPRPPLSTNPTSSSTTDDKTERDADASTKNFSGRQESPLRGLHPHPPIHPGSISAVVAPVVDGRSAGAPPDARRRRGRAAHVTRGPHRRGGRRGRRTRVRVRVPLPRRPHLPRP